MNKKGKVFVGISGGVDSSVAALLLKREGYDVTGVFMKNWADPQYPCPWREDRRDAMRVAALLEIPFETWDFTKEYKNEVVARMIREYAAGRTPNPDVMCNREIKFGLFLRRVLARGADFVATGHYVRKSQIQISPPEAPACRTGRDQPLADNFQFPISNKIFKLKIAKDKNKDQTYFLWTLGQREIAHALFPVGGYTKPEVRRIAREFSLPTAEKPDSQGICFIGEIDVAQFLRDQIPARTGEVVTASGKKVGTHDGVSFYTIGQRHGLGIGGGVPYYVAEKEPETNTLIVAEGPFDKKLFAQSLTARAPNWISGIRPKFPFRCEARIRYRQPLQKAVIRKQETGIKVKFENEQRAITPGQSAVFYKNGVMLGGGIID